MKQILMSILALGGLAACGTTDVNPAGTYDKGVLVLNAGNFFDNNGTISSISRTGTTAQIDIFQAANQRTLAGGLAGYAEVDGKGIILVDNATAGKDVIEIVNATTFKSVATIPSTEIENPRNIVKVSATKAYITCWDATGTFPKFYINKGYVAVLDLTSNKITKKIKVQEGAEDLVVVGNEVFVGNTGTWATKMSVIDIATDAVKQTIEVGSNPSALKIDANNKLWILADDNTMMRMNPSTKAIEAKIKITASNAEKMPSSVALSADKKTFFYTSSFYDAKDGYKQKGATHSFPITATEIKEATPFINRIFDGGLDVDPISGNIYGGKITTYKTAGYVIRYTSAGKLIDSVKTEIVPSKFYFKK
jgi:hypothetical protein